MPINTDILNSAQYGPSPMQYAQGAMKIADMVNKRKMESIDQQENEAIKQLYPKYLDGNADGDVNGYLTEVSKYVRPEKVFQLQKEFSLIGDHKKKIADQAQTETMRGEGISRLAETQGNPNATDMDYEKLAQYESASPEVASTLKYRNTISKQPDEFGKTPTGLDLKYASDPEYKNHQKEILKGFLDAGKITPETYGVLLPVTQTRPVSWMNQLPNFLKTKEESGVLDVVKTGEEIKLARFQREKAKSDAEKAAREEAEAAKKQAGVSAVATAMEEQTNRNIDNLVNDFETGKGTTGIVPNFWAKLYKPSEAGTRKAYFEQLKSSLTLKKLTDLKAAGGTLGALSDREREMLDQAASVLDFEGSTTRNINALKDIKKIFNAAKGRVGASQQSGKISPEDQQAIEWAKSNPKDPRAAKILQIHGM